MIKILRKHKIEENQNHTNFLICTYRNLSNNHPSLPYNTRSIGFKNFNKINEDLSQLSTILKN